MAVDSTGCFLRVADLAWRRHEYRVVGVRNGRTMVPHAAAYQLSAPLAVLTWALIMLGVVSVVISAVFGHSVSLYTFLYPLSLIGSGPGWATVVFLIGMMLVNLGWMIWRFQMLGAVLRAYGGFRGS